MDMTTTLIVPVHPAPASFTAAWARASADAARRLGHRVLLSDLYAQGFDPAEAPGHYPAEPDATFDVLKAQEAAAANGTLPPEIGAEIGKLTAADNVIFHFPLWWFGPPAMLKGWFDRVLVHGGLHDVDRRFDAGLCRGKRAVFCVSTGSRASESGADGKEGNLRLLLWPAAYTLHYLGFTVLKPVAVHGVHGYHQGTDKRALNDRLSAALEAQPGLVAGLDRREEIAFNADSDFDAEGRLRPDRPSVTPFIRHPPQP